MKLVSILLIVVTGLVASQEDVAKRSLNCDTELDLFVNDEDKMLRNYIIRNDVQEEFKARNENDEACMLFLRKILVKIEEYKNDDDDQETKIMKKRDDEIDFLRDERARMKRKVLKNVRKPFSYKY